MLRNYIGDDAFFASLKLYLETNQYTDVEMHQLRLACEKVTGEDLNWFFNQWFYAKGHPELNINYTYNDSLKTQTVTVEQMQKLNIAPLYYLPVNIDIYVDGKVETHKVIIDKLNNEFTFNVSSKPNLVNFDSDKMLLCEKVDNHKTIEECAFMYNNAPRYMDRYEAIQKIAQSDEAIAAKTMIAALNDDYPYLRRGAIRKIKKAVKSNSKEVKAILLDLAKNDKNSKVRGDALSALSTHYKEDEAVKSTLISATSEESYYVIASSLEGLSEVSYDDAMKFAKSFENEKNSDIQSSISSIYANHAGKEQNGYFIEKIKSTKGYGKYSLVSNYAKYLKKQDDETVKSSVQTLKVVATTEKTWWIRLTGINTILNLEEMYANRVTVTEAELKELKAGDSKELDLRNSLTSNKEMSVQLTTILKEIKATEKHPRLRKMMGLTD
jgi:aminopeptidase N